MNGLTLSAIAVGIFWEASVRWRAPEPIKSVEMLIIAAIGLMVILVVAFVLGGHQHAHAEDGYDREDVNVKSAFLHVVGDAVSSAGVIVAALVIWWTGWAWVDPLASVLIGIIILLGSWRVLRPTLHLLMEDAPDGTDLAEIGATLADTPVVREVHDLHIWSLCIGHGCPDRPHRGGRRTIVRSRRTDG